AGAGRGGGAARSGAGWRPSPRLGARSAGAARGASRSGADLPWPPSEGRPSVGVGRSYGLGLPAALSGLACAPSPLDSARGDPEPVDGATLGSARGDSAVL